MYLIDNTYFKNKYEIENILEEASGNAEKLNDYVENFVVEFLQDFLGAADFENLNSHITDGVLDVGAPSKWLNLVNGKTYSINGKDYVWKGLLYKNGSVKRSLLTNYVFCAIVADIETNNGKATLDGKNVVRNVMRKHYVNVWNEFAKEFVNHADCGAKISYINGVEFIDWYGGSEENGYVNLVKFLEDNKTDYPNYNGKGYEFINSSNLS